MCKNLNKLKSMLLALALILGVTSTAPFTVNAANKTQTTEKSISVNTAYTDIVKNNEVDYYKFNISDSSKININVKHNYVDNQYDYWYFELYNSNGDAIINFAPKGNKTDTTSYNTGVPSGVYYLKVSRTVWTDSDINYTFKINCSPQTDWEKEPNDTYINGTDISLNKYYYGATGLSNDVDYYKFSISTPSKVSINVKHEIVDNEYDFWYFQLYNLDGIKIIDFGSKGNKSDSTSYNVGLPKGNYYIKVSKTVWYDTDIDYSFRVNCSSETNWEKEPNNTYADGTDIKLNEYYYGTTGLSDDVDYYKFAISSTDKVNISVKHNITDNIYDFWYFKLYSTNGNEILNFSSKGNQASTTSNSVSLSKGDYYIKVSKSVWYDEDIDYSFSVNTASVKYGDVNCDGRISILDATEIQKHLASLTSLNDMQIALADTNKDGRVSILDATLIQKALVGLAEI